ncbi:STAS domain-containing protein [Geomesophilobacter sediminis]|uniref:STAS domain-containing protein n=1 Tax=Geomesophilobacter sediminis TaxID=2798584 RepID=A0A8J7JC17_9BACT|nr:STAS domain-containing protein [Geomesophilobacter sediminis]MBJ6724223.1 hypothetical protein [Geomesophilobacter sediminis]
MNGDAADGIQQDYFALEGNIGGHSERLLKDLPARVSQSSVRFDFTRAGKIDSMGLTLLLRCFKEIRETKNAEILVEGLTPMHSTLFRMTGVFLLASMVETKRGARTNAPPSFG